MAKKKAKKATKITKAAKVKKVLKPKKAPKVKKALKTKERKDSLHINKTQLKELKAVLSEKREDLLKIVSRKKHEDMPDNEIGDEVDSATQSVEKEILFELTNNEKVMLDAIEAALRKIEKESFGACESCAGVITFNRLKAMPWVRYCIGCQKKYETPE